MRILNSLFLIFAYISLNLHGALSYNVVCYFESWWIYRPGWAAFKPSYLDGVDCTHIIYAFTELHPTTYEMYELDNNEYASYKVINDLKYFKPGLKTMLAIGGAGDTENRKIASMARDAILRVNFARTAVRYLRKHNFDGLDVDWEFPKTSGEKKAFSDLLGALRQTFEDEADATGRERLLLSSAVSAWDAAINRAYDVPYISSKLDFISVMTYDLHGSWQKEAGHNAPLRNSGDDFNVEYAMNFWLSKGAPREKLNVGIPTYGRGFNLANQYDNGFGAPIVGPTPMEVFTQWEGVAGYFELCPKLDSGDGLIVYPNRQGAPYYTSGKYWIGYDNPESVGEKAKYIVAQRFAGAMIWALGLDDFAQNCQSSKTAYPLLRSIVAVLNHNQKPETTTRFPVPSTTVRSTTTISVPSTTTAPITGEFSCQNRPDGKYADPKDCSSFYECKNGHMYDFGCPAGLCYDETKAYCDWADNIGVKTTTQPTTAAKTTTTRASTTTTTRTTTTQPTTTRALTTTTTKTTTTQPTTKILTTKMTTTTSNPQGFSCIHMASGLYADPMSCEGFIWCLSGKAHNFSCPGGLFFNAQKKTCDWPDNVSCSDGQK